jgi:DNA-binding GntR family transcriptional regulator
MVKRRAERPKMRVLKGASSDFAYQALKKQIVSFGLRPGADLDEAALVEEFGVSRTPVREALVRLAAEGLVQLVPNRGARVSPLGWEDIREHLEAFDVAQRLVTRWAALRRTNAQIEVIEAERRSFDEAFAKDDAEAMLHINWRFHAAIATACRNSVVERFYLQLLTENLRIARLAMTFECYPERKAYRAHVGKISREHEKIVQAIRERDADRADALAHSHAGLGRKRVSESLTGSMTPAMVTALGTPVAV